MNGITANSIDQTVDQMKAMKLSDEMVSKVQEKLESDARESVRQILDPRITEPDFH